MNIMNLKGKREHHWKPLSAREAVRFQMWKKWIKKLKGDQ
jgi:hypothetical protein